jgi:hypothetical protein
LAQATRRVRSRSAETVPPLEQPCEAHHHFRSFRGADSGPAWVATRVLHQTFGDPLAQWPILLLRTSPPQLIDGIAAR